MRDEMFSVIILLLLLSLCFVVLLRPVFSNSLVCFVTRWGRFDKNLLPEENKQVFNFLILKTNIHLSQVTFAG